MTQTPCTTTPAPYCTAEWSYNHTETHRHLTEQGKTVPPTYMLTSAAALDRQIADMERQGYTIHGITLHTFCGGCQGSGRVPKRDSKGRARPYAWKTCSACKGHEGPLTSETICVSCGALADGRGDRCKACENGEDLAEEVE